MIKNFMMRYRELQRKRLENKLELLFNLSFNGVSRYETKIKYRDKYNYFSIKYKTMYGEPYIPDRTK